MSPPPRQAAPVLAITETPGDAQALRAALEAAGAGAPIEGSRLTMVQLAAAHAPSLIVCWLPQGAADVLPALAAWRGAPPCALCVIGPLDDPGQARALAEAGVAGWDATLDAPRLAVRIAHAQALHEREAGARAQLDERKWVDRAKGLLMSARAIAEDDAFKLLRSTAMHANLKLTEVSRSVIDAARWAEAVNRAGQLRMLSQRLVSLAAQRLARVDAQGARERQAQAAKRAQANLDHLATLGLDGEAAQALAAATAVWKALQQALAVRLTPQSLVQADECADALLAAADALTAALEAHGARRALGIVNLCGRQRMRTQRLAKEALLAALAPLPQRGERLQAGMDEFEQALREIEATPLSSPEIRAALAASREGWRVLLRALHSSDPAAVAHAAEALLEQLDRLTDSCEHSLQVLLS
ncbi:ANTAR domain-containing response regulator [Caldimonas sp. KR1-144]|uniref:ANTAR domain-containing response regulator n=1 Tax=Caldimonas sp. KR1-144 TaxID=3400911 RepID=UPI003C0352CA